jgi:hypothetical protein
VLEQRHLGGGTETLDERRHEQRAHVVEPIEQRQQLDARREVVQGRAPLPGRDPGRW